MSQKGQKQVSGLQSNALTSAIANQKTQRQTEAKAVTIIKPQGCCEHQVTN